MPAGYIIYNNEVKLENEQSNIVRVFNCVGVKIAKELIRVKKQFNIMDELLKTKLKIWLMHKMSSKFT